jgi:lysophospholipase L1-like esterase
MGFKYLGARASLQNLQQQLLLKPVGFRDTSPIYSPARDNTNQTGTSRVQFFPQVKCQDIVLAYSNYYVASSTSTPNTNSINVKVSLEVNGVLIPVFFNGRRTVTIDGGATIYSDPIGCIISPTDSVFVRTYWDAGTGGYIPCNVNLVQININGVQDGVTYGSDLTDSGTVTNTASANSYGPRGFYGIPLNMQKSYLLVGDSIIDGTGDTMRLLGNTGFAAIALFNAKIGSTKISTPGETAQNFLTKLPCRAPLIKNHTAVICDYGINDINGGVTLANLQSYLLSIWRYFATRGLAVYQTTITPKTTSTDLYMTTANQTVSANESVRLAINSWLRDTSPNGAVAQSGGSLARVLDTAAAVETNGKWNVYATPIYSGTVSSAGTNYIVDNSLAIGLRQLDNAAVIKITGGTGAGQTATVWWNDGVHTIYVNSNWTTTPDSTSTYQIYNVSTYDGTHPTSYGHKLIANTMTGL